MDKICVNLYGGKSLFGGKETPSRAETIFCDKAEKCTLYKSGKCLNVTAPLSGRCKFGKVEVAKGYTSRAQKYHSFQRHYREDETYNKLANPSNCRLAVMDDYAYINVVFSKLKENEQGIYYVDEVGFGGGASWIPLAKLNTDIIHSICSYMAYSMMGSAIRDYTTKHIPEFLYQLSLMLPELHKQFITEYPQDAVLPNHVGKYAKLSTVNRKLPVTDIHGAIFTFDGDYLINNDYKPSFAPFDAKTSEIRIKITDDMKVKITDNNQVTDETVFE